VAPIDRAEAHDLAFVRDARYLHAWPSSRAGITLVSAPLMEQEHATTLENASDRAVLVVPDADIALVALLGYVKGAMPTGDPDEGVHPSAVVHESATIGENASIGAFVCIGAGAVIGDNAVIRAHSVVGLGAHIGNGSVLRERVVIGDRCVVGERTTLHAGVVVGADGFGYRPPAPEFGMGPHHVKIPHIGIVVIGDDVEIGANSCVDRATHGVTRIGNGCKIDNLCQIGHNVTTGTNMIMCGDSAIGGSTAIGDNVTLAGQVGVADNITVGDGATITAKSGATGDVAPGDVISGVRGCSVRRDLRKQAASEWLADHVGQLRELLRREGYDA
jgi:UDP-3-O-[3-hydroxymyristoyl] glucosamine N-acyltransferase